MGGSRERRRALSRRVVDEAHGHASCEAVAAVEQHGSVQLREAPGANAPRADEDVDAEWWGGVRIRGRTAAERPPDHLRAPRDRATSASSSAIAAGAPDAAA